MASTSNAGINPIAPAAADRGRCRLCCRNVGGGGVGRDGRVGLLRTVRGMKLTWWTVRGMNMNLRKGGPAIGEEAGTVRARGTFQDTMGEVSRLEDREGAGVVSNTRCLDTHQQTHTLPYENVNVETRSRLARPSTSGGYPSSSSSRSYSHSPYEGVNVETRSPYPGQSSYRRPRIHYAPDHTLAYATYLRENPYAGVNMEERVPYEDQRHHESRHQPRERDTRRVRFAD